MCRLRIIDRDTDFGFVCCNMLELNQAGCPCCQCDWIGTEQNSRLKGFELIAGMAFFEQFLAPPRSAARGAIAAETGHDFLEIFVKWK